jgi:uncharacterized membrane protein YhiD involved in acid resistance
MAPRCAGIDGRLRICAAVLLLTCVGPFRLAYAHQPPPVELIQEPPTPAPEGERTELGYALVRLPLAAALGAVLALRPKRRGTPTRTPAVVQTQVILAVVGALIMLVVGASLARAFGIVGAANLIRYRSKIDDPKDAGVMLCTLAIGLACGVGLYGLSVFGTLFLLAALAVIESFEPTTAKRFDLHIRLEKDAQKLRAAVERVLDRYRLEYELRATSDDELSYEVTVPFETETDQITDAILRAGGREQVGVAWDAKKPKT